MHNLQDYVHNSGHSVWQGKHEPPQDDGGVKVRLEKTSQAPTDSNDDDTTQ